MQKQSYTQNKKKHFKIKTNNQNSTSFRNQEPLRNVLWNSHLCLVSTFGNRELLFLSFVNLIWPPKVNKFSTHHHPIKTKIEWSNKRDLSQGHEIHKPDRNRSYKPDRNRSHKLWTQLSPRIISTTITLSTPPWS